MRKLNEGIILEDCLISFLIISVFLVLMTTYMEDIYSLKNEIKVDYQELTELKQCMLLSCDKSQGNNTRDICKNIAIKSRKGEVCVSI